MIDRFSLASVIYLMVEYFMCLNLHLITLPVRILMLIFSKLWYIQIAMVTTIFIKVAPIPLFARCTRVN